MPRRGDGNRPHSPDSFILCLFFSREEKKRKASAMTDQISHQMPGQALLPGPLTGQPPSPAAGPRRCKQPGCGTELPAATGRGAPRLFCSPACSRKWHNDNRSAAAGDQQATALADPSDGGPLAGLHQLLTQAAGLASAAAAQLAAADPGKVTAALAAADAARGQAQAETAVALARSPGHPDRRGSHRGYARRPARRPGRAGSRRPGRADRRRRRHAQVIGTGDTQITEIAGKPTRHPHARAPYRPPTGTPRCRCLLGLATTPAPRSAGPASRSYART